MSLGNTIPYYDKLNILVIIMPKNIAIKGPLDKNKELG